MSPTVTICVTAGSDSANHGSLATIGVSQLIALVPTWWAATVALSGLDSDASWNTVAGSILSPLRTSLTPKPLAYTVFPPCTTATAMPGMPDFFISSSANPSSLATALSTALSGRGMAGTNGGGTSECGGAACLSELHPAISSNAIAMADSSRFTAATLAGYSRHHGSNVGVASGSTRWPGLGTTTRTPSRSAAASSRSAGSAHGWGASRNVAQWMGTSNPESASATSRCARTASSWFMWMSGHAG